MLCASDVITHYPILAVQSQRRHVYRVGPGPKGLSLTAVVVECLTLHVSGKIRGPLRDCISDIFLNIMHIILKLRRCELVGTTNVVIVIVTLDCRSLVDDRNRWHQLFFEDISSRFFFDIQT